MHQADIEALFDTNIGKSIYDNANKTVTEYSMHERLSGGVLVGFEKA